MHLSLQLFFRRRCLNFINVRTAYDSKIQAPPTKKSSCKFRNNEIPRAHYNNREHGYFQRNSGDIRVFV